MRRVVDDASLSCTTIISELLAEQIAYNKDTFGEI